MTQGPHGHPQGGMREGGARGGGEKKSIAETAAKWFLKIPAFFAEFVAKVMKEFTVRGSSGAIIIGSTIFIFGLFISANTYWQTIFKQPSLFPFWEDNWVGWGWLPHLYNFGFSRTFPFIRMPSISIGVLFDFRFFVAMIISCAIQIVQAASIRSMVWKPTPVAGISPKTVGLLAITLWVNDLIQALYAYPPLRYEKPEEVLLCFLWCVYTIFAAELGLLVYLLMSKDGVQE